MRSSRAAVQSVGEPKSRAGPQDLDLWDAGVLVTSLASRG
jgi:hypothetical protein